MGWGRREASRLADCAEFCFVGKRVLRFGWSVCLESV